MDHRRLRFPDLPEPEEGIRVRRPAALREPLRIGILAGLAVMLVGDLLPWLQVWLPYRGFFEVSGFERAGDAGLVLELALVILALTWSDQAWNSRTPVLVAGPFAAGVVCLLVLRNAWADGASYLRSLDVYGGYGSFLPWFWVTVLGAAAVTAGGAMAAWRSRGRVSYRISISRATIAGTVGGIAGGIGGFLAGVRIGELLAGDEIAMVWTSVLVLLSISLGFGGAWVGAKVGANLGRPAGDARIASGAPQSAPGSPRTASVDPRPARRP